MNQATILEALIKAVILIGGLMTAAAYLVLLERGWRPGCRTGSGRTAWAFR